MQPVGQFRLKKHVDPRGTSLHSLLSRRRIIAAIDLTESERENELKKQGDFGIFGVVNGEKNEPISVISTILLESMVLLRMRGKREESNGGRVEQDDWLVVDVEIVRHEGEFPAEIGVQTKLMSDFEVE